MLSPNRLSESALKLIASIRVSGMPAGQPRPRSARSRYGITVYDSGRADPWRQSIALAARQHVPAEPFLGPVMLIVRFYFERPKSHRKISGSLRKGAPRHHVVKPDFDNLLKAVSDELTDCGFWRDDSQIYAGSWRKSYCLPGQEPGCTIQIFGVKSR